MRNLRHLLDFFLKKKEQIVYRTQEINVVVVLFLSNDDVFHVWC